jgi:hypothetical protein
LAVKKPAATTLVDDLTAPFDEDQKSGKTFPPHVYLRRLLDVAAGSYSITRANPVVITVGDASAIAIVTNVTVEVEEGVERIYGDVGATGATDSQEDKDLANAIKSASSDSLKRALLAAGVNLDTYEEGNYEEEVAEKPARSTRRAAKPKDEEPEDEEEDEKPARRSSKPAAKPAARGKWTGDEEIGFGKYKDKLWSEIHGGWLAFCESTFEDSRNKTKIEKEIARREDEGTYDPEEDDGNKPKGKPQRRASGRTAGRY